jgi:hypothetical protein
MSEPHPLDQAIEAVDRALAHRPRIDGTAFTEATKAVCIYRDRIRDGLREHKADPGDEQRLADSNLALTLLTAGHFPLGGVPWEQIEGVRHHLCAMKAGAA